MKKRKNSANKTKTQSAPKKTFEQKQKAWAKKHDPKNHHEDAFLGVLDAALTASEVSLVRLLPEFTPAEITDNFIVHCQTHLSTELDNVAKHGHRNDDPDDIPDEARDTPTMRDFIAQVARMKTESEFGDNAPPSEDWISTLNDLIGSARKILPGIRTAAEDDGLDGEN